VVVRRHAVELYRKGGFTKDALVGWVRIPKLSLELDNRPHEHWFPLRQPSKKGTAVPCRRARRQRPHD